MSNWRLESISAQNSALVLVDYQPAMFRGVGSGDRTLIFDAALAAAKAAKILDVPVVLTAIGPERNGEFISEIASLFPNQPVIARKVPGFDAFEDSGVWEAVKQTGRRKIVVSGLWTSMCFAYTALHGLRQGLEMYGLDDAAGDATVDAHVYGLRRMYQAGVAPVTWMSLVSEWMHDWANPKAGQLSKEVYGVFDAMMAM